MDYKIPCIDIAETQRARIISKYCYLFSPVNSIGYLMNATRLRQDFSVRPVQLEYLIKLIYDTYKHQTQVFYFILYYIMFYVQQSQQAHYKYYKDLYWHCH
jgi:hypothetical protein